MREFLTLTNVIILYFCIAVPVSLVIALRKVAREKEIRRGRPGQARVVALRDTGARVNQNVTAELTLEVEGAEATHVVTLCSVPPLATPRFQPGSVLPVRIHPSDPSKVLVDMAAMGL